jgi:sugar/nucleoside kinase (ribokinase family)
MTTNGMREYDIVFMGHLATATIFPFEGPPYMERGGQAFFGPIAAACLAKRTAAVTSVGEAEADLLEPMRAAGIDLFIQRRDTTRLHVIHPSASVDDRQMYLVRHGGRFSAGDVPSVRPGLIHLGGLSPQEFPLDLMRDLKSRGFRLSVDMQSFLWHVEAGTGAIHLANLSHKEEILGMIEFAKFDVMEGEVLTGATGLEEQAAMLEEWGCRETVITCSHGALARSGGRTAYAPFTNKNITGRTGRGDTFSGAYLARRLDYPVDDSLAFAAALTSIKMESLGPFTGSMQDVLDRMGDVRPSAPPAGPDGHP